MPLGSNAFLSAAAARPVLSFPVSLVSTAGPRAHPLQARCGTQFASRHRESERRPLLRFRYAIRREPPACSCGEPAKDQMDSPRLLLEGLTLRLLDSISVQ